MNKKTETTEMDAHAARKTRLERWRVEIIKEHMTLKETATEITE